MIIGIDASRANRPNKTGVEWYSYHLIQELKKITSGNHPSPLLGKEGIVEFDVISDLIPNQVRDDKPCSGRNDQFLLYTNTTLEGDLGLMPTSSQSSPSKGEGVSVVWQEKRLSWPPKYLWTQIRLWWELVFHAPDILFVPAHTIPFLPIRAKTRVYVTVHDVGFKRYPELYKKIQFWYHHLTMKRIKHRADKIITISDFSKQEIVDLYQVEPNKIIVIPLGYDKDKYNENVETLRATSLLDKYKISQPYLLYVGRLEKKKNIGNMINALAYVKNQFLPLSAQAGLSEGEIKKQFLPLPEGEVRRGWEDLKLVLAGNTGNEYASIKKIIADNKLENEILLPGYIAEADLPTIIKMAEIFLFPTLYEGFGLPILQALAIGTPVVTSDLEPQREVAGGAAALADPKNPESIAQQINKIIKDREFRAELQRRGLKRAGEFSWEKTARETLAVILKT